MLNDTEIMLAYAAYDSDPRARDIDGYEAFRDAVQRLVREMEKQQLALQAENERLRKTLEEKVG